jgi:nucleoside-triphosphatase THEP1
MATSTLGREAEMAPLVIIVGADKGSVGKTTISRTLMDYFRHQGVTFRGFDTEAPTGVLKRFFPDKVEVVDLTKSDGQMRVFDTLKDAQVTIIDVRAGLLSPTLKTLSEIGFLDGVKQAKHRIAVLHVIGSSEASFQEIKATAAIVEGAKHYLVVNHATDASFMGLSDELKKVGEGVIDIGKLNELAAEHVDQAGAGFDAFVADESNSAVLRGYVKAWMGRAFQAYDAARLAQI